MGVAVVATCTLVAALAATGGPVLGKQAMEDGVHLAVTGRINATPSIAASGLFVAVAWGATITDGRTDVFVATSTDGGSTFGLPVQVNTLAGEARLGGELPPRVALRRLPASARPEVAVLWTARGAATSIKVARSTDGGRTFEAPRELQSAGAAGDRGWPALALDGRGVARAIWLDHRGLSNGAAGAHTHGSPAPRDGVAMAERSGLYFASAMAGGTPAERELAKGVCYCCKTALTVASDGTIHAAWRHVYAGNLRDIAYTTSHDGGRTFSAPIRVSEDGWQINGCPDDGPAMAVGAGTTLHIVWPTVVTSGAQPSGAIFHASSSDGRSFTPRSRVTLAEGAKPSHPQVVVDRAGAVVVAWDQADTRTRSIHVERLGATEPGMRRPAAGRKLLETAGSYPVLAATATGLVVARTAPGESGSTIAIRRIR